MVLAKCSESKHRLHRSAYDTPTQAAIYPMWDVCREMKFHA